MTRTEPKLLSRSNASTLRALAEVLVPMDDAAVPFAAVDLIGRVERILEGENPALVRLTRLAICALEYSPLLAGQGFARFSGLDARGREECVRWWEDRPSWRLRSLFYLCKVTVLAHLYDDAAVAAAVGYRP